MFFYVDPLFERHHVPAFSWLREFDLPFTDSPGFQEAFNQALEDGLQHGLEKISSLESFVAETSRLGSRFFGPMPLPRYNGQYGRALAALGRLDEAEPLLAQDLADDVVTRRAANPNLPARMFDLGPDSVERHAYHTGLLAAVRSRDHHAVAALLRDCERLQAERWKVGHLWKPTAFPVEELA